MAGVTIASTSAAGEHFQITLEKTASDRGLIRIKSWPSNRHPATTAPATDKSVKLFDIKAGDSGAKIVCKGDASGFHVTLTCTVHKAEGSAQPFVRVVRSNTFLRMGDGTDDYATTQADYDAITQFIANAGFPALPA